MWILLAVGADVPGFQASWQRPGVIDPTVAGTLNPNAIPASPQGGNAIVSWDSGFSAGSTMSASEELVSKFQIWAYLETDALTNFDDYESTSYGLGTTGTQYNFPDPAGNLFPVEQNTANGNIGVGWVFQRQGNQGSTGPFLYLVDFGKGGNSSPNTIDPQYWNTIETIDVNATSGGSVAGWHRLSIDYDPTTGAVVAGYDDQTFDFDTETDILGTFFVGYRKNLAVRADGRPPTFDTIKELEPLLGDVNLDEAVNGLDVNPFVTRVLSGDYLGGGRYQRGWGGERLGCRFVCRTRAQRWWHRGSSGAVDLGPGVARPGVAWDAAPTLSGAVCRSVEQQARIADHAVPIAAHLGAGGVANSLAGVQLARAP